ncbi:MAG: LysR family transcriptional regulator, partial [Rubrimonas sp.]
MRYLTILRYVDAVARAGSIRKAAEALSLTPSAMNRRIQAFEAELGEKIFERLPRGVRLNPAGELILHSGRRQMAELDRVRSQIADLAGVRRGHVAIACSQALAPYFLPQQVAEYGAQFPAVTFDVQVCDRLAAERALVDYAADVALVFGASVMPEVQTVMAARQTLHAVVAADHPLAERATVRLRDCLSWPLALPSLAFGGRQILERAVARTSLTMRPVVTSDSFEFLKSYVARGRAVTFQIPVGAPPAEQGGLVSRPLDARDVPDGALIIAQLRGRTL